ncbi:hydantoinase/oxoprolinase family protein [Mycobacterium sp. AZCC_0083]|uniref:hydantoinase/oxoprolinase family protein n=1 Tax=Mycobacterium sp. AZCC_0083 TaxID=2735882 RepID=UPI001621A4BD|nr:hydantoinase/oxoprolinase family protein [Mycobacterium sp. AZCC_0083]MBB5167529.1 N-methylhydantoinase A [Mycobacterium sp. AZCC_0083]
MAVIGIDVGGTFTDGFFHSPVSGEQVSAKSPTTRPDPTEGIVAVIDRLLAQLTDTGRQDISEITVGSTLALNAVIEGRGSRTALVTTEGFRDVLEIGRESRAKLYDLDQPSPKLLVPRSRRFEITERILSDGSVETAPDLETQGPTLVAQLRECRAEAVAICLINSFIEPSHERLLKQYLCDQLPELYVSASCDVVQQYREYERTLVTCINAYVGPTMLHYLEQLERTLASILPSAAVRITDSTGGAVTARAAGRRPVLTVMSGPAAGVAGAAALSREQPDADRLLAMDMGGTSCDVTVIRGGVPETTSVVAVADFRFILSAVDVNSIGAGGGTVAWVDRAGLLRVGPRSTGSSPGPACYGNGGQEPTITDAHVVLGHLVADEPLGGTIAIDVTAATEAIEKNLATPLGITVLAAARGVLQIADAAMQQALESITVRRGLDPRDFDLIGFGGAGPLHAASIGRSLGVRRTIIPRFAGALCAMGAVWSPERYESSLSLLTLTARIDGVALSGLVAQLCSKALSPVNGADHSAFDTKVRADMRFVGQGSTLPITLHGFDDEDFTERAHGDFLKEYQDVYGYVLEDHPSEIENLRVVMTKRTNQIGLQVATVGHQVATSEPWQASFDKPELESCELWRLTGNRRLPETVVGPAVILGEGSTAVIYPEQKVLQDAQGNLIISY